MIKTIFCIICAISFVFALISGNIEALSGAGVEGAGTAVTLTISLMGMMALWCGVMKVMQKCGVCEFLARLISPLLRIAFPDAPGVGSSIFSAHEEIAANISANMLGMGNAATPFGIKAMEALSADCDGEYASDDMVTFVVMNTSAFSFMPSTVVALRQAAGAADPFDIITAVWICSGVCMIVSVIFARGFRFFFPKRSRA